METSLQREFPEAGGSPSDGETVSQQNLPRGHALHQDRDPVAADAQCSVGRAETHDPRIFHSNIKLFTSIQNSINAIKK